MGISDERHQIPEAGANMCGGTAECYRALLDASARRIFVSDCATHELLYANRAALESRKGGGDYAHQPCFGFLLGRGAPCEDCCMCRVQPGAALDWKRYNPEQGTWEHVVGEFVNWQGRRAMLHFIDDITETESLERELRDSQHRYELAVEGAGISVWEYDPALHRTVMSQTEFDKGGFAQLGLRPVMEHAPDCFFPLFAGQDLARCQDMYRRVGEGENAACEVWRRGGTGQEKRCERIRYTVVSDADGHPVRAYGMAQDITAQKKAEERYRQEMDCLREAGDASLLAKGHFSLTRDRVLEFAAGGHFPAPLHGERYSEFCARLFARAAHDSERAALAAGLDRVGLIARFQDGITHFELSFSGEREDDVPIWVSAVANTFQVPSTGEIECFLYLRDVTDKTLEKQILSRLPMLGFDVLGLLYVKTGICRYYRIKKLDVHSVYEHLEDYNASIGGDIERIVLPEQRAQVREGLRIDTILAHLAENELYPFTYTMKNREGKLLQKLLQFSYFDENHDTLFFCKSDITKQYESERMQIERLREAKLEADRANEAKSVFLSSMSHDLRTPLNGVIGFSNLALREKDPDRLRDYLGKIRTSGILLQSLVNDTLELSRIESGKYVLTPEAVSLRDIGTTVLTALQPSASLKRIALSADTDSFPDETLWADRLKLEKIFLNLLSNAIKYTLYDGTVELRVDRLDPPQQGCGYRIAVQDSGIGISEKFLPRLYEPFAQEHRPEAGNVAGTGLGLAIVKKIVDLMGGQIQVESKVGKGTCFTVLLPLAQAENSARSAENAAGTAGLQGRCVLLCEDNYLNTEIACTLLKESGIRVDCAVNGREGTEKFAASAPGTYDAILMDLRMPEMDGYEATRVIRALPRTDAASVPIVAMTADAFEDDVRRCLAAGMNGHVAKPFDPEELLRVLAGVCRP